MRDCRDKALDLVARRPHFRRELQRKLLDRGFGFEDVEIVLEELTGLGVLDDLENAEDLASGPMTRKGFGPRRMKSELQRRGVDETTADTAVARIFSDSEEELRRAREAAGRKAFTGQIDRGRLARHLDRKGFSKPVILRIVDELGSD